MKTKPLVAVYKDTSRRVSIGQRLIGLKTRTSNRTVYLFNADGDRIGWVSGDVIDALDDTLPFQNFNTGWLAVVHSRTVAGPNSRLTVTLEPLPLTVNIANLRGGGFPEDINSLDDEFEDLYTFLNILDVVQPTLKQPLIQKEAIMTSTKNAITSRALRSFDQNKSAMSTAAYLEAGRLANKHVAQLLAGRMPMMLRGYADTPVGKLVIANLFAVAMAELRPDNAMLGKLGGAMLTSAHQDVIQTLNIEGLLDELLNADTIKSALGRLSAAEGEQQ